MAGEATNPVLPAVYTSRSFNDVKLKELYGENPSASQQKKFNKYLQSEQGQWDKFNFDKEESNKVFAAAEARLKAKRDFYQKQRDEERAKFEQATTTPTVVTPVNTNDDNKPIDTTKQWEQHMTQLGYTPTKLSDGSTAFRNNNVVYYNNGRMMQNRKMSNYDYNTLTSVKAPQTQTRVIASEVVNNNTSELKGRTGSTNSHVHKNKQGGTMNKIKYFQQGGQPTAAGQQDIQQQVIALVQAAMQGDQKATQTVNKIMEAAKAGDQQAMQIAQMIQQVAQKMQGQATAAKWGAKLGYIRSLKYAHGGKTCPACQTAEKGDKIEKKACGGKKAKKRYFGGWL